MSTPSESLTEFLKEKGEVYAEANVRLSSIHKKHFAEAMEEGHDAFLLRDPGRAVIEKVKESGGSAIIITREPAPRDTVLRLRYHLVASDMRWRIVRMDRQCSMCRGEGKFEGNVCPKCNGEGWCG